MIHGTIKLLNSQELVIDKKPYNRRSSRQRIIDRWEVKYPDSKGWMIEICPIVDASKVRKDGTNIQKRKLAPVAQPKIERPPAIYDNHRPYDYS